MISWALRIVLISFSFLSNSLLADDLSLLGYTNQFGQSSLYLRNDGKEKITVLTKGLMKSKVDEVIALSPPSFIIEIDGESHVLKDSVYRYGVVVLEPGEITYLENVLFDDPGADIRYKIDEDWARLHDTWSGSAKMKMIN